MPSHTYIFQLRIWILLSTWLIVKVALNCQYRLLVSLFLPDNMIPNSLLSNPHFHFPTRKKENRNKNKLPTPLQQNTLFQNWHHQPAGLDSYRTLHPTTAECVTSWDAHETCIKIDNILGHKINFNKCKRIEIT